MAGSLTLAVAGCAWPAHGLAGDKAKAGTTVFADDFETQPQASGWTGYGWTEHGRSLLWKHDDAQAGTGCLAVVSVPGAASSGWESPPFRMQKGTYYRTTFSVKTPVATTWAILFYDRNGALVEGDHNCAIPVSPDWSQQEYCFKTKFPGETATLIFTSGRDHPFAADDVRIDVASREEVRAWADRLYAGMPPLTWQAPKTADRALPRTIRRLRRGGDLKIVLFGDSIANDIANSPLDVLLERSFPGVRVDVQFTGRGGVGYAKLKQQVSQRVLQHAPDLVILEAISNEPDDLAGDLRSILDTVRRTAPKTECLLVTPHVPGLPAIAPAMTALQDVTLHVAAEQNVAAVDLHAVWKAYLEEHKLEPATLLRDPYHMNERGRQLAARVLTASLEAAARAHD